MGDVLPDREALRLRKERQLKSIEITMLDQEIQNEELAAERKEVQRELRELNGAIGSPIPMTDLDSKRLELARRREELVVHDKRVRVAEIDETVARHRENIEASRVSIADLTAEIDAMNGGESNG